MTEVAIITGASGDIGEAVARRLAAARVHCVLVDRDPAVKKVAADIGGLAVVGDLSDPDLSTKAVAHVDGRLDMLVLNAETGCTATDPDVLDLSGYRSVVGTNQHGVVYGLRAALPLMRRRRSGSIVITASLAGLVGVEDDPFYTMTKHAVIGLVRASAGRLAREGIRLSAVCPGPWEAPPVTGNGLRPPGVPAPGADEVAAAIEHALRTAEPGTQLVLRPGRSPVPYAQAPLP
ncbi:dehydrogenase [Actinomadura craniellae]|uniref:Dehydrogenase n=1 Tax=Actinomadura craniellae TaxID=2231787 RepID=A0A365HD55_9ACTN|nr:SDR family NAD(P)-dependent oxidoreductase [Actinomadura craniellae]RAY17064.1 dehydrogenase [Actinomadura craniellae]